MRSTWMAAVVGMAVGLGVWGAGLEKMFWPEHPHWALLLTIFAATTIAKLIFDAEARRKAGRAQSR